MHAFLKLVVAVLPGISLAACLGRDMCANTVVSRLGAPGGAHIAVMFERNCGATTGFSTQISILRPGEVPDGAGNVLIAADDEGVARAGDWGGPWAEIQWLGPDRLLVRHAAGARIFLRRYAVSGVQITYQATNEL